LIPTWVETPDPSIYLSDNYLVLDFENTIIDGDGSPLNDSNSLLLTCWKKGEQEHSIWGTHCDIQPLIDAMKDVDFIVAQGSKHELQWLKRAGVPLEGVLVYDTLLAQYVLNGNRASALDLGSISKRRGFGSKDKYIDMCMKAKICPSTYPRSLLQRRCLMDIRQTEGIFLQQRQELHEQGKLKTLYTRCLLTPVLADIEFNGMHLDEGRVNETYTTYAGRFAELGGQLSRRADGINFRSNPQLAAYLYDTLGFDELKDRGGDPIRTAGNGRKVDSGTISQLKASNQSQREFIGLWKEYNSIASALSKNLEFFKGVVDEKQGTFLGQFNQSVTATHRLSSSGRRTAFDMFAKPKSVQFQNMPRIFKNLFSPRTEGWLMGEIDGAQLEFRVAAQLGMDDVAIEAIITGFDVHSYTAETITGRGQPTTRQEAKAHTFKPLFGGNSGTKAEKAYYTAFKERYKGITTWQDSNKLHVLSNKSLVLPTGLEFFWPDTKLEGDWITNSTQICNYPVQSVATGDIIPIGLIKLWHEMKSRGMQSFLVNTIHDSAIAELHPDELDEFAEISSDALTTYVYRYLYDVYDYKWAVPLAAGLKIGTHWSEGEETLYNNPPLFTLEEVRNEQARVL
jgi:DNA polymerase I-like protein with 3'-5' exonuclease and polymerase domains